MNKFVLIVYNEALDQEVMEVLEELNLNYTKIPSVLGKGRTSGLHLGDEVWPGKNNLLLVALEEEKVPVLLSKIRQIRKNLGRIGIKAFVWDLKELT